VNRGRGLLSATHHQLLKLITPRFGSSELDHRAHVTSISRLRCVTHHDHDVSNVTLGNDGIDQDPPRALAQRFLWFVYTIHSIDRESCFMPTWV